MNTPKCFKNYFTLLRISAMPPRSQLNKVFILRVEFKASCDQLLVLPLTTMTLGKIISLPELLVSPLFLKIHRESNVLLIDALWAINKTKH